VDTGTHLRLTGEGESGLNGGPSGDLYVEIRVQEHPDYHREGIDLRKGLKISYLQALLGCELEVSTLREPIKHKGPRGTPPGHVFRVQGQGLPHLRTGRLGDLLLEVEVEIPTKLGKEEERLLRKIAETKDDPVADSSWLDFFK
jgi:molecular chaperone DnaJ